MNLRLLSGLLDFFYPPRCLVCNKIGAQVHPACRAELPFILAPFCSYCGLPLPTAASICDSSLCLRSPEERSLDRVCSVFRHSQGARQSVLRLKYKGVSSLTDWLVSELAGAVRRNKLEVADGVLAVPLHSRRLRERGYNQAGLLAVGLSHYLNLTSYEGLLVRSRETRSQVGLDGSSRTKNMRGAFTWQGKPLEGQTLLLIDDVCTTGATLSECAGVLKLAGASRVWGVTVTRELRHESQY
ncbi:MAG: ComF family protein [Chloroflexota bacterium]|nr:ComF family protein [Chloroflexota bacterium]